MQTKCASGRVAGSAFPRIAQERTALYVSMGSIRVISLPRLIRKAFSTQGQPGPRPEDSWAGLFAGSPVWNPKLFAASSAPGPVTALELSRSLCITSRLSSDKRCNVATSIFKRLVAIATAPIFSYRLSRRPGTGKLLKLIFQLRRWQFAKCDLAR